MHTSTRVPGYLHPPLPQYPPPCFSTHVCFDCATRPPVCLRTLVSIVLRTSARIYLIQKKRLESPPPPCCCCCAPPSSSPLDQIAVMLLLWPRCVLLAARPPFLDAAVTPRILSMIPVPPIIIIAVCRADFLYYVIVPSTYKKVVF